MIALHTLFLREHNRLVKELYLLNPHWSPDTLYQEARKIMGAIHQIITWEHYLPRVLGEDATSHLMPPYKGYDPEVDPSIANVFAAAAFRFAHVTVQPVVTRLGPGYTTNSQHPPLPLHHSLFASWRVVQEGGIDPVLRGLLLSPAKLQTPGQMMVEELTERLFQAQGGMPLDLGALNLQRGRDHGLPATSLTSPLTRSHASRGRRTCWSVHTRSSPTSTSPHGKNQTQIPTVVRYPGFNLAYSLHCDSVILYHCHSGFKLLGSSSVSCDPNSQQWSSIPTCQDINECEEQVSLCPQNLECLNIPGSFICSEVSPLSAVSVVTAVMVVIGGVAALLLLMFFYRRYFPKKEELVNARCCQGKS
ncbi:Thyroid peroxidase [Larimichthys crocea]|uniref:Uncharacterized protein n=1 Tax=Larimichthys crocea TaxID=215358 RepID=A0ACD3QEB5_LARCR|nr:Thyroid peroxidase [Larimichthys crocea]